MLKMNYSDFYYKSHEQIGKAAERRGISRYNSSGKLLNENDLIGAIIAHDAYYEGKNDALRGLNNVESHPRKKYILQRDEETTLYLELTKEQVNFFRYLERIGIDTDYATLEELSVGDFEAP